MQNLKSMRFVVGMNVLFNAVTVALHMPATAPRGGCVRMMSSPAKTLVIWDCDGCLVDSEALLKTAELAHKIRHADTFGLTVGTLDIDYAKVVERSRAVSASCAAMSARSAAFSALRSATKVDQSDLMAGLTARRVLIPIPFSHPLLCRLFY